MKTSFTPGKTWNDTDGIPIQAHGGGILYDKGVYYWYGEYKDTVTLRKSAVIFNVDAIGISCYSSTDLYNWKNRGLVLAAETELAEHELHTNRIIERPKVVFNELTGKYVMFMHLDTINYEYARVGIATSNSPTGPFNYLGSLAPNGSDSRDMTFFKDDDRKAYLIHSSEWNATMYVAELGDDYCQTTGVFTKNFQRQFREAPAVFKRKGKYYLLTSGCSGWDPNEAQYAVADNILGPWNAIGNPCIGPNAEKTFLAQGTFVFPVAGKSDAYIAMFDIWKKKDLGASTYVWLPVKYVGNEIVIEWLDEWDLSYFK